jgi:hypothetical protein
MEISRLRLKEQIQFMKRYLALALVAVLALILPTFAEMESQKCGPYLVTFNLTTIEKMNFSQMKPVYYSNNVLYGLASNQPKWG